MKLVSIIIPVFDTPDELIDECIGSIADSSYKNLELIIIDDGSKRSCADHLDSLIGIFPELNIRVYHQNNRGPSSARNYGMEKLKGDYVLFVDSDDLISPDYIMGLIESINVFDSDIAYSSMQRVDVNGGHFGEDKTINRHSFALELDEKCRLLIVGAMWDFGELPVDFPKKDVWLSVCVWGKLFRRKILSNISFDVGLVNGEDQIFTYDALQYTTKISFTNIGLYYYRMNDCSIMHTASKKTIDQYMRFFEALKERIYCRKDIYECKLENEVRSLFRIMTDNINFRDYRNLMKYLYMQKTFQEIKKDLYVKNSKGLSAKTIIFLAKKGWIDAIYFVKQLKLLVLKK